MSAAETVEKRIYETSSFAMNLFRGQVRPEEVFPFREGMQRVLLSLSHVSLVTYDKLCNYQDA